MTTRVSTLEMRNLDLSNRRTTARMEPELWRALEALSLAEGRSVRDICTRIDLDRGAVGMTSALKSYIVQELMRRANLT